MTSSVLPSFFFTFPLLWDLLFVQLWPAFIGRCLTLAKNLVDSSANGPTRATGAARQKKKKKKKKKKKMDQRRFPERFLSFLSLCEWLLKTSCPPIALCQISTQCSLPAGVSLSCLGTSTISGTSKTLPPSNTKSPKEREPQKKKKKKENETLP